MKTIYLIVKVEIIHNVKDRLNLLAYTDYGEAVRFRDECNQKNDGYEYEIQYINLLDY